MQISATDIARYPGTRVLIGYPGNGSGFGYPFRALVTVSVIFVCSIIIVIIKYMTLIAENNREAKLQVVMHTTLIYPNE